MSLCSVDFAGASSRRQSRVATKSIENRHKTNSDKMPHPSANRRRRLMRTSANSANSTVQVSGARSASSVFDRT